MTAESKNKRCLIIGASHAGVNCAFYLRQQGWEGPIVLFDADPELPYHRPPLSKAYLSGTDEGGDHLLKSEEAYEKQDIELRLGVRVTAIDRSAKEIELEDGRREAYDKLVLATGARAFLPPVPGLDHPEKVFTLRTLADAQRIQQARATQADAKVVVIGGGYIGLEVAASLHKLGSAVTVIEREDRLLARVASEELSTYFAQLHQKRGVEIATGKNVVAVEEQQGQLSVQCADGTNYTADLLVVGVGVRVNTDLAAAAGLELENGIRVDATTRSSDEHIYAIGDCSYHHNPHYDRFVRLESVQNAIDQAKVAAAAICGSEVSYKAIPWFWSDQYDVKLQMVGLSTGYEEALLRKEEENSFSIWYFKGEELLAVDAVNNARAYVLGGKFISTGKKIDKAKLLDVSTPLKPAFLLKKE